MYSFSRQILGTYNRIKRSPFNRNKMPFVNHVKLIIDKHYSSTTSQLYEGLSEWNPMLFLMRYLSSDDVFFDIGANVGIYTLLASGVCGGYSYAFEPDRKTFLLLNEQIRLNNLENLVTTMQIAVGAENGITYLSQNLGQNNHIVSSTTNQEYSEVNMITLDSLTDVKGPTVMKIDVEGYEHAVLSGSKDILLSKGLRVVIAEEMGLGKRYSHSKEDVSVLYRDSGFKLVKYIAKRNMCKPLDQSRNMNIFVKDLDEVNERLANHKKSILIQNKHYV
jgi:FkbM family methyltransferase